MLFMIGLGLNDEKDITLKAYEAIKKCRYVFLESYTSMLLNSSLERLEKFYDKKIILADRDLVEKRSDEILDKAVNNKVAFLVVGDVFSATTHADLYLRAKEKNIEVKIIHNASILTAVSQTGLSLYNFGKTTSMPFFEHNFRPETPYDVIKANKKNSYHSLVLLDIKPDRLMTINIALRQLLEIEEKRKENVVSLKTKVVGCARLGSNSPLIKYGEISKLISFDFGSPLHCLVFPGKLHFIEKEMLELNSL